MAMIDPSSAFDLVDHKILLDKLQVQYAISGVTLEWFRSDLDNTHSEFKLVKRYQRQLNWILACLRVPGWARLPARNPPKILVLSYW